MWLLLLFFIQSVLALDLQEYIVNRNVRSTESWINNGFSYGPEGQCVYDSDCGVRLGTELLAQFGKTNVPPYVYNNLFTNRGQNFPDDTSSGTIGRPASFKQCVANAGADQCCGFNLDPNSGTECAVFGVVTPVVYTNAFFDSSYSNLFQTWVNYPDLRCVSGKCIHLDTLHPGFGVEYCTPSFRFGFNSGGCSGTNQTCVVPPLPAGSNPVLLSQHGPVEEIRVESDVREFAGFTVYTLTEKFFGLVFEPRYSRSSGAWMVYSSDRRDTVGKCHCAPGQCPNDLLCLSRTASDTGCYCSNSHQCGVDPIVNLVNGLLPETTPPTLYTGVCLTNGAIQDQVLQATALAGGVLPTAPFGTCSCTIGSEAACNYNGICTDAAATTGSLFPPYITVEDFNVRAVETSSGRCSCYGQYSVWGSSPSGKFYTINETVVGSSCEADSWRYLRCSGRGRPICPIGFPGATIAVFSLNQLLAGVVKEIGVLCPGANFTSRGVAGICQCDPGWAPDNIATIPGGTIQMPCSEIAGCANSPGSETVGGACECTIGNYQYGGPSGSCVAGCDNAKANGHGTCTYTGALNTHPGDSTPYSNDVQCDNGWATLYNRDDANKGLPGYYAPVFNAAAATSVCSTCTWIRLSDLESTFCTVPVNPVTHAVCGMGVPTPAYIFLGANSNDFPVCYCTQQTHILDNSGQPIPVIGHQAPIPYCASTCLPLAAAYADPPNSTQWNNHICGGPKRGACMDDSAGGQFCKCNNGYSGVVCQTRLCPIARGLMCGGSGVCDAATARCVCNPDFYGLACEFGKSNCAQSQPLRSYPLPIDLPDY